MTELGNGYWRQAAVSELCELSIDPVSSKSLMKRRIRPDTSLITVRLEVLMATIGEKLRQARIQWGLSLREVRERSIGLAKAWGSSSYEISGSWLARLERGKHEMTVPKLISLAAIYSKPPEELLREYQPNSSQMTWPDGGKGPNVTLLVKEGPLGLKARQVLPDNFSTDPIPDDTMLLPLEDEMLQSPYRRAIIGQRDRTLDPMIRPGSIIQVDTQVRSIASRKEWANEFDRPIYLLYTHAGYVCGWCELDKEGIWLTLVAHSLSPDSCRRWRYRKEVEVIGRAVAIAMRLSV
jgi:transcriptional regulator with XRE-family HTH domain